MKNSLRAFSSSCVILLAACATPVTVAPRAALLAAEGGAADLDALVESFYGAGLPPARALAEAEAVLRKHPYAARAHEVAGYAALLMGNSDATWAHFRAAAADLDADATEFYLWESGAASSAQHDALDQLLDALRTRHPRAEVRALAAYRLAVSRAMRGSRTEAERIASPLGAISTWQLLGALDNDQGKGFYTELPPEQGVVLSATVPGPLVPLRWRAVEHLTPVGAVPLEDLLWPHDFGVAYLATWIHADAPRKFQLRLTSSSPARAFVNGALALSEEHVAGGDFDNMVTTVELAAGWNQLLVKSAHRRGDWQLLARLTDESGEVASGLRYASTPQPFSKAQSPESATAARAPHAVSGPESRKRFLEARMLFRDGRPQAALDVLQPWVDERPLNVLGQYFGALALWDNEELGQGIDLLNKGIAATGEKAAGLLAKRGHYYAQKQLWEKALADLNAAIALDDHARGAQVELSQVFERRGWQVDRCRRLDRILERWPDDGWALRERGECAQSLGYQEEAERLFGRAAALTPGNVSLWWARAHLARWQGHLAEARRRLAVLQKLEPSELRWLVEEGDVRRTAGDRRRARACYERASQLAPEAPQPWEHLGELEHEAGNRAAALVAWKRAQERDPNDSALAQRVENLEPTRLGYIEKYVPGEAEIDKALAATTSAHPGAQIALLIDHEIDEVNGDGSARRVVTEVQKALDEKGRDGLTSVSLPRQGAVKVLRAYAITEHGDRQEASSIRGSEVRFRNLQVGSRTVLQYVHYMPAPHFLPGAFVASWFFQSPGRQHDDSTWVLVLPHGHTLHVETTGEVERRVLTDGDRDVTIFHAAHSAPIVPEANMPPPMDLLTHVDVSTVASWDDYVRWERALLVDAFRTSPVLDALTDRLVAEAKTPKEKLDRLFHHVAQEIHYQQDYENTIAGVRPHAAPVVVERGYGDCKDKAVLLIQLARRAGITLHFAILRTLPAGKVRREVPNQQFNHAIVYVPAQPGLPEPFFLDPTAEELDMGNLRPDDQGAWSLVVDPLGSSWSFIAIPYQASALQFDHHRVHVDLRSPTDVLVSDEVSARGVLGMGLRHALRNEGEAKKVYEAIAAAVVPGGTLREGKAGDRADTWHPIVLSLSIDGSGAVRSEDDRYRLTLPGRFPLSGVAAQKKRETPLHMGPLDSSTYDVEVALAEGQSIAHAPKDFKVEHACFSLERTVKSEERKLTLHLAYERKCVEIAPADYAAFRTAVQDAVRRINDDLVFAKATTRRPKEKR